MTAMLRCVADISWKRFVADAAAALHGWIVLDKPVGMTSTHAVSRLKRIFNAKKAGHAGTLDPLASGILPVAFGEATHGGIAGHLPDRIQIDRQEQGRASHSSGSQSRFNARMARSDDNHIIPFRIDEHVMRIWINRLAAILRRFGDGS